ncbi:glycosyltransferase family 39 protein [Sandaracinus amylolyticus]|uniref:glycosyltransferase family 39 protein n=1 Tax=Sandaracinus amylolyticus TaxID=927083 RepID=UPI001F1E31FD|nr:glycosyltransferase family 39 protein [Sandaracinus amylolyticus]UJR86173.1 Hypothetical protein I5071_82550 [Sandaracinus amylolyticus]
MLARRSMLDLASTRARWALRGVVIASVLVAVALLVDAITPARGRGLVQRTWRPRGEVCAEPPGDASREVVRDAVVLPRERARRCITWSAAFVTRFRTPVRFEIETNRAFVLRVEGDEVLRAPDGAIEVHAHEIDLARGAHPIELALAAPTGPGSYLRVRTLLMNGARPWGSRPVDLDEWHVSASSDPGPRTAARTIAFALALIVALSGLVIARRRSIPTWLSDALIVFVLTSLYFVPRALSAGFSIDELAYVKAGENYVANLLAGDFETAAWRWNMEHPPVAKWVYGWGALLGGWSGARATAALCGALAVALIAIAGRVLVSRRVGLLAAALLVCTPHYAGLMRTCTLEAVTCLVWAALLVVLALWVRDAGIGDHVARRAHQPRERVLRALAGALPIVGTFARATSVWSGPLSLLAACLVSRRRGQGGLWIPWEMIAGGLLAVLIVYAGWPWLWPDPREQFGHAVRHFTDYLPLEWYRGHLHHPGRGYFTHAFLATTPELHLIAGALGAIVLARRSPSSALLVVAAFLLPFAQSLSHVRQDLSRYVITAWLGLALLAAIGTDALGVLLAKRNERARLVPALVVIFVATFGLLRAEPHPRTYFAPWTGGAPHVAETRAFEIADWCEGLEDATAHVNAHAGQGERVEYRTSCRDLHDPLRDDLIEHRGAGAQWVISQRFAYELDQHEPALASCTIAHDTVSSGVVVARVWDCR